MDALTGPVLVLTALLALAGAMKLARPAPTAGALRAMQLPARFVLVRTLGAVELVVGVVALCTASRPWLALTGAAYLAFAAFVAAALVSGAPLQSCGCFGRADTPPTVVHLAVNVVAAATLLLAAATHVAAPADTLADQPCSAVPFVALVATSLYLTYLVLTALPAVLSLSRVP